MAGAPEPPPGSGREPGVSGPATVAAPGAAGGLTEETGRPDGGSAGQSLAHAGHAGGEHPEPVQKRRKRTAGSGESQA